MALGTSHTPIENNLYDLSTYSDVFNGLIDSTIDQSPFLRNLLTKRALKRSGGRDITQQVQLSELTLGGSYNRNSVFQFAFEEVEQELVWPIKQYYVPVTLPEDIEDQNDDAHQILDAKKQIMERAQKRMYKILAGTSGVWGDATGNGGLNMNGIKEICDDVTNYTTWGGLARGTYSELAGNYDATTTALTRPLLDKTIGLCEQGAATPDLGFTTHNYFNNKFLGLFEANERFVNQTGDTLTAGYGHIMYRGVRIEPDRYVPANRFIMLSSSQIALAVHKKYYTAGGVQTRKHIGGKTLVCKGFKMSDFKDVVNQPFKVARITWKGNLVAAQCNCHAIFTALTET